MYLDQLYIMILIIKYNQNQFAYESQTNIRIITTEFYLGALTLILNSYVVAQVISLFPLLNYSKINKN